MGSLNVIQNGWLTTVQDRGRSGLAYYAFPTSGSMEATAAEWALDLVGVDQQQPLLECAATAPQLQFNDPTLIALTGADFGWKLNAISLKTNRYYEVKAGDMLTGTVAVTGGYGYVAIRGSLLVDRFANSAATYVPLRWGGFRGRPLRRGDRLAWTEWSEHQIPLPSRTKAFPNATHIPLQAGPEWSWLSASAKRQFLENSYSISTNSNRMGARLRGNPLPPLRTRLRSSVPVLPGFVQLPPDGQPIVILRDGQTTGGYPRIAYLRPPAVCALVSLGCGRTFQFTMT